MLILRKTHHLKIMPEYFNAVISGAKRFELRRNDRDYQVGEYLMLREWYKGQYTGNRAKVRVEYVLQNVPGLKDDYCILSISPVLAGYDISHEIFDEEEFGGDRE